MATNVCWRMSGCRSSNWLRNGSSSQSAKSVYSFIGITRYLQIQDCKCIWMYITEIKNNYFITCLLVDSLLSSRDIFFFCKDEAHTASTNKVVSQILPVSSDKEWKLVWVLFLKCYHLLPFLFSTGVWKNVTVLQSPCNNPLFPPPQTNSYFAVYKERVGLGSVFLLILCSSP